MKNPALKDGVSKQAQTSKQGKNMDQKEYLELIHKRHTKELNEWITSDDTGNSSKTVWSVIVGIERIDVSIPYDEWDFGRCYRLLDKFNQSEQMAILEGLSKFPQWKRLVINWRSLINLYEKKNKNEFYDVLRDIIRVE